MKLSSFLGRDRSSLRLRCKLTILAKRQHEVSPDSPFVGFVGVHVIISIQIHGCGSRRFVLIYVLIRSIHLQESEVLDFLGLRPHEGLADIAKPGSLGKLLLALA